MTIIRCGLPKMVKPFKTATVNRHNYLLEKRNIKSLQIHYRMSNEVITDKQKKMARYAKALAHPVRLYVMELLSKQSCCYSGDLTDDLPIAKSTLSAHLKELKNAGLIQGEIEAPKIKYCINKKGWEEAKSMFKEFWSL